MLKTWLEDELGTLETGAMLREVRLRDSSLINFASNDYLGLARHPSVIAGAAAALKEWGASASSSRLLSGHTEVHAALEKGLAEWLKQDSALVFPAGYMANVGVITALAGQSDAIIMDRLCHASLVDGARLSGARLFVYRHGDATDAERVLKRARSYRRRFLLTESLFSMDGDLAPLEDLKQLASRYDTFAIVDEAHALGVMGPEGRGLSKGWDVVLGTLSKALGSQGGFVAASDSLISFLINKARPFIFTTGLAPANAGAALAALRLICQKDDPGQKVLQDARRLQKTLTQQGWDLLHSQSQIVPIYIGDAPRAVALAGQLRQKGFYAPAIRPPAVHAKECRIRLSVTASHSDEQISRLVSVLGECRE